MTEGLLGGWRCMGSMGGILSRSKPALIHRPIYSVKGSGLPILGRILQQRRRGGANGRSRGTERAVRCIITQALQKEVVPRASEVTQYNDSLLDVTAIEFLTNRVAVVSGQKTDLKGYDGFVDITRKLVHGLPSKNQRDRILDMLHVLLPNWFLLCFRIVPRTTFVTEAYAKVASVFFKWLVGHCEVREGEVNGVLMKSTVHIKKCRYLEQSQCVGLCVNLCKSPTEEFIGKQLGMPLTMVPNFEDMSCDMIYGLSPPPFEEDAAYQQPCYELCSTAKKKANCA